MEKWDIYTQNREKTKKTIERGQKLADNEYRLTVHACIFNNKGQLLIQQRQPFKKGWANMWDVTIGGCVLSGETSQQAIARELHEELGYEMDFTGIRPQLTVNFDGGFDDIYLIQLDGTIDTEGLKLQYEEVQSVRWASLREIEEMIHNSIFIPYYENLIKLMFDMKGTYGCFKENKE
ncbi:MAG: NUDIX domain-containing protein [Acutalibacteraceae bacterium]|nr:NUDIX domain-containing protein [Acutalibacteraceae bacterium]